MRLAGNRLKDWIDILVPSGVFSFMYVDSLVSKEGLVWFGRFGLVWSGGFCLIQFRVESLVWFGWSDNMTISLYTCLRQTKDTRILLGPAYSTDG